MCLCICRISQEKQVNVLQSLLLSLSCNPLINCLLEGKSETGIHHWMSAMITKPHNYFLVIKHRLCFTACLVMITLNKFNCCLLHYTLCDKKKFLSPKKTLLSIFEVIVNISISVLVYSVCVLMFCPFPPKKSALLLPYS